jgi:hypothetical protein
MPNTETLRGSEATLQFVPRTNVRAGQLAQSIIADEYSINSAVGRVTGVEVCIQTDLEVFHEIGRRHAVSIHPGNVNVYGRVERAYINGALLRLLEGESAQSNPPANIQDAEVQPFFDLVIDFVRNLTPNNSGGTKITVEGVRFENWSVVVPEDDFVMENMTFKAIRVVREEKEAETL